MEAHAGRTRRERPRRFQLSAGGARDLRAVARLQSATGHPAEAIRSWQNLKKIGAIRPADRQDYADDLFHSGDLAEAASGK